VPYLQLDVPNHYPPEVKRDLARRMGELWAEMMQTTPYLVDVGIRELGEGSVWRCGPGEPEPTAVLTLDIRQGRPPEQRARVAQALLDVCRRALGLRPERFSVEFTQHTGDETYQNILVDGTYHGGFAPDWNPDEGKNTSILDSIPELKSRSTGSSAWP